MRLGKAVYAMLEAWPNDLSGLYEVMNQRSPSRAEPQDFVILEFRFWNLE
ncbi:hypothetical protein ES703_113699 [subsurface metagenome]